MAKLSPLWVRSPSGRVLHRKREYGAKSKTLCGLHTGNAWVRVVSVSGNHKLKCKRCAA